MRKKVNSIPLENLRTYIQKHCLISDFKGTLASGKASSLYFDCKKAMLDGECLDSLSLLFYKEIRTINPFPDAVGGPTIGADFIVSVILFGEHRRGLSNCIRKGSIVRKESKAHGTRSVIENQLPKGTKIVVVDDVITSGGSILHACRTFKENGYEVVGVVALIDRQEGGKERIEMEDFGPVRSIFTAEDFV